MHKKSFLLLSLFSFSCINGMEDSVEEKKTPPTTLRHRRLHSRKGSRQQDLVVSPPLRISLPLRMKSFKKPEQLESTITPTWMRIGLSGFFASTAMACFYGFYTTEPSFPLNKILYVFGTFGFTLASGICAPNED